MITDKEVIKLMQKLPNEEQQEDEEKEPESKISHQEAANALKMLQTYFLQQPDTYEVTDNDRKVVTKLFKEAEKYSTLSKKQ